MSPIQSKAILAAVLCLCAIQVAAKKQDAEDASDAQCFAAHIDGFKTIDFPPAYRASLKEHRNGVVAGYNADRFNTAVSVFIYDKKPNANVDKELNLAVSEVLSAHSGAELARAGKGTVPLAGEPNEAYGGIFIWSEGATDLGSFLWIIPKANRYVKLRATYVRPEADQETAEAMRFAISALETFARSVCDPDATEL